ncbi:flagellar basal body rod protein FlgB [Senegalia massiliensis]|uniref:flagellar basal body rod protein FlgB n=1 Tax=Senegalia massiliensis TaxID=1720316 RepID=UPI001F5F74A3|nr:flagellar basal body rod protein FlgB [Senegalia massiliensis]
MLNGVFNNMNLMNTALDGYSKRNEAINNNISNVNTPGYKKNKVSFEENLKEQLNMGNSLKLNTTNSRHIGFKNKQINTDIKITKDNSYSTRNDGNNVNIDVEMANLTKNTMLYNAIARQVSNESKKIRNIIREGR